MTQLSPGDTAPAFTLPDAGGKQVSLADYAGRRVVVYFYPQAGTPGCTTEACDFRDNLAALQQDGYDVVGISPDGPEAIQEFIRDQALTFPLLSDPDLAVIKAYGAYGERTFGGNTSMGILRSTVTVDEDGKVLTAEYGVSPAGHVARLREELAGLQS
ncbi:thioredoxin-dependent thiol peroxidase [Arthrobacter sp. Sa2BUA2]|uniref:thioredoxin-dependent peroxiredoxin n=1 Tax=Arthrobacter pullicola TaxID=2762224 RepID=A0ABR8YF52_9MICC|nr:thioredoxin-dependent thiol peroxidase [Arthrobacter pullicola]MBD8042827.1 thioredoxin-dependent thiol peroxidase [Arthrobacter pullicola]